MEWYFIENGQQAGPVDEATFNSMLSTGRIKANTQVWRDGMPNWAPCGTALPSGGAAPITGATQCAECGNVFPPDDLIQIGGRAICAACKPIAVQKLKEGVINPVGFHYAGFWMRFAAWLVDYLIMVVIQLVVTLVTGGFAFQTRFDGMYFLRLGLSILIPASYSVFLIGAYGSTLGMMACGIRVVRPDGEKVSYLRALGRHFAAMLSGLIIAIGFIMIAFDDEKRALHDHICDTRVVYK